MTKEQKRLQKYWDITNKITKKLFKALYNYSYDMAPEIEGNYLVLANHNCNFDPWLCGLSFKKQMYFLAGENLFRLGILSWCIKKLWNPISKIKGKSDVTAMMKLIRLLKQGNNASLFPEGNRSFNGETGEIIPSIGKLVKTSGAAMVTYRLQGMYCATPRWGRRPRKGKTHGSVVNIYSKEKLSTMSVDEINKHINEDLYENAFTLQEQNPIAYKSNKRAECIEAALFMCPKCNAIGSIRSKKNEFHCCKCNAKAEYSEYCLIEGNFGYKTVLDWDKWQVKALHKHIDATKKGTPILEDDFVEYLVVDSDHNEKVVDKGALKMYHDKIQIGSTEIPFTNINDFAVFFRRTLMFTTKTNENCQVFHKDFRCARSYLFAFRYLMTKNNIKN